jgi:hypothetical protein
MSITTKTPDVKTQKTRRTAAPQLRVQSGLRAGGAQGSCDVAYWRSELNYWKNLAKQMGCA